MRKLSVLSFALALVFTPAVLCAQTPQTYSMTWTNTMGPGLTVKIARDGSKESLEQIVPKSANGPGMHIRQIYDFATHKYWTISFDGSPCVLATYTSPALPGMFDPITGADEIRAGLAQAKPAVLRSESVNGIATKVYEMPVPEIKGKMRVYLEEKQNFAVKMVLVPGSGKEQTQLEIQTLSFEKPPADLFVPPQNCQVQGGEASASGGRAESKIDASASGEMQLGEAKPPAQKPAAKQPAAAPASRPPAPSAAGVVVEVRGAGVSPLNYDGPAPAAYTFNFSIESSGPVEADWVLVSQADTAWASGKLVFEAAGTKDLIVPVKIGVTNGKHWEGAGHLEIVVGTKRVSSVKMEISADPKK